MPLHLAVDLPSCSAERVLAVELLLSAAPEAAAHRTSQGRNPLHIAVHSRAATEVQRFYLDAAYPIYDTAGAIEAATARAYQLRRDEASHLLLVHRLLQVARQRQNSMTLAATHRCMWQRASTLGVAARITLLPWQCAKWWRQLPLRHVSGVRQPCCQQTCCPPQLFTNGPAPPSRQHSAAFSRQPPCPSLYPAPTAPADRAPVRALCLLPRQLKTTTSSTGGTAASRDATTDVWTTTRILTPVHTPSPAFAELVKRVPLIPEEWKLVPRGRYGDPCLAAALPAVLQRSTAEAAFLVGRLPEHDRSRLAAAVQALSCPVRRTASPRPGLPVDLVQFILSIGF